MPAWSFQLQTDSMLFYSISTFITSQKLVRILSIRPEDCLSALRCFRPLSNSIKIKVHAPVDLWPISHTITLQRTRCPAYTLSRLEGRPRYRWSRIISSGNDSGNRMTTAVYSLLNVMGDQSERNGLLFKDVDVTTWRTGVLTACSFTHNWQTARWQ